MKTSVILIAMLMLVAAPTAIAAPEPTASASLSDPVELYPCFNGGVTIVVRGQVVAECLGG